MVLFFLGFMLAIGLLAYSSLRITELDKQAEQLSQNLKERYSKPLTDLNIEEQSKESENEPEKKEEKV
jgi:divalent metal cation (Fe/Co/Zn/Cd) transporter